MYAQSPSAAATPFNGIIHYYIVAAAAFVRVRTAVAALPLNCVSGVYRLWLRDGFGGGVLQGHTPSSVRACVRPQSAEKIGHLLISLHRRLLLIAILALQPIGPADIV